MCRKGCEESVSQEQRKSTDRCRSFVFWVVIFRTLYCKDRWERGRKVAAEKEKAFATDSALQEKHSTHEIEVEDIPYLFNIHHIRYKTKR